MNSGLAIINDEFFLLDAGKEGKSVFVYESLAIDELSNILKITTLNPEQISLWKVNISGEKWGIESVPWSRIAGIMMRRKSSE